MLTARLRYMPKGKSLLEQDLASLAQVSACLLEILENFSSFKNLFFCLED